MSRSVYASVEKFNKVTNKWEFVRTTFLVGGVETTADYYLGAGQVASALLGDEDFDYCENNEDEYSPDKKRSGLREIGLWFDKRMNNSFLRDDFSPEVVAILDRKDELYSYIPRNITFTYADIKLLKQLAKSVSKRAKNYYKANFSDVENLLDFIYKNISALDYSDTGNGLRAVVYVL